MIENFSSQNLFLHYSSPSRQGTGPLHKIFSVVHDLLQILSTQHHYRHKKNAVFLSEESKNIIDIRNFTILHFRSFPRLEIRPFLFPIPLGPLLRASENFLRIIMPCPSSQEKRPSIQRFFNHCGINNIFWFKIVFLQAEIRNLLSSDQEPFVPSSSSFKYDPPDCPFWIDQDAFFTYIFTDCQSWEISVFQVKYLNVSQELIEDITQAGMSGRKSLHLAMYMFFLTIHELSTSPNHHAAIYPFCLQLAHKCIDFLAGRLSIFRHPSLMSCLLDELFMFSGLICDAFSKNIVLFNYFPYRNGSFFIKVNPVPEWHLRYQTRFFKDIDLCYAFINAYTAEGRSPDFLWPQYDPGVILETIHPFLQEIFSYWLTACHNKIFPFMQAHNNLSLLPSPRNLSLASLSAIKVLEQGSRASDEAVYTSLNLLLRDDEKTNSGNEAQSFVKMRAFFYKYHSEERVKKCIEAYLSKLKGYIDTSSDDQAKACFLSLLHMTSYCEISFTSFQRIQLTSKLLVHALIQFGSPLPCFTFQSLFDHLMLLFSTCRCNFFEVFHSRQFWRSVIQLFSYKKNSLREAKLKRLYEDEAGPSSAKKMKLS